MHDLPADWQQTFNDYNAALTRRQFFRRSGTGLGVAALASLLGERVMAQSASAATLQTAMTEPWKIAPKAKRAIYISLIGAPSQLDLFDYKPALKTRFREDLKDYLGGQGQRLTGMTSGQAAFPVAPSIFKFAQHGQSGMWISELLPNIAKMSDDLCFIRSMKTDAINHEPANQLVYTGSMQNGKASIGSWLAYGLGSLNADLPRSIPARFPTCRRFLRGSGVAATCRANTRAFRSARRATPCFISTMRRASRASYVARCSMVWGS